MSCFSGGKRNTLLVLVCIIDEVMSKNSNEANSMDRLKLYMMQNDGG